MLPETELRSLQDRWVTEAPASDLADRIIRHALMQEQRLPLLARIKRSLIVPEQSAVWKGGFAIAACVMIAIVAMDDGKPTKKTVYQKPMDQLVEEMILDNYQY